MQIAIYSHTFAPAVGGVETYVQLLASALSEGRDVTGNRNHVTVITKTQSIPTDRTPFRIVRRPSIATLWKVISEAQIIHIAGPCLTPMVLSIIRGVPMIIEHHGYQAICPNGLLLQKPMARACPGYFLRRQYRKCFACERQSKGLFATVASIIATAIRRLMCRLAKNNLAVTHHVDARLQLRNSSVIYHGIPPGDIPPAAANSSIMKFGYVGRLVAEKGLSLLVEAMAQLKEEDKCCNLTFVGEGPERQSLEGQVVQLGLRSYVRFAGLLTGRALNAETDQLDVVVMPSIWEETAGLAAIEHMMRGRCVIAADIGGLSEVVGSAGLKFEPGSAASLAASMRTLIDDRNLLTTLGKAAQTRARKMFSLDRMMQDHLSLYESSCKAG